MERMKKIACFSKLDNFELEKLAKISSIKTYDKGDILFYEGDFSTYLYALIEGSLKTFKTTNKGGQLFLHHIYAGSLIAEAANFENIPYPATAEFLEHSVVLKIDYNALKNDFFGNTDILFEIIKGLTAKQKILTQVIQKELIFTAEAKVAKFLIEQEDLVKTLKNTQIASLLNITPETLSRILSKFKTQELTGPAFEPLQRDKLKEL